MFWIWSALVGTAGGGATAFATAIAKLGGVKRTVATAATTALVLDRGRRGKRVAWITSESSFGFRGERLRPPWAVRAPALVEGAYVVESMPASRFCCHPIYPAGVDSGGLVRHRVDGP